MAIWQEPVHQKMKRKKERCSGSYRQAIRFLFRSVRQVHEKESMLELQPGGRRIIEQKLPQGRRDHMTLIMLWSLLRSCPSRKLTAAVSSLYLLFQRLTVDYIILILLHRLFFSIIWTMKIKIILKGISLPCPQIIADVSLSYVLNSYQL